MVDAVVRRGGSQDIEPAIAVWRSANTARRSDWQPGPDQEARMPGQMRKPDAFLFVAEAAGEEIAGMALGMQALADDGRGPPVHGLCHVSMVFVAPRLWGRGIGGRLLDALLAEARSRGYDRVQLWTQVDNKGAMRLYEGRRFRRSGREKYELDEWIVQYARAL